MSDSLIGWVPVKDWVLVDIYDDGGKPLKVGNKQIIIPSDIDFGPNSISGKNHEHKHRGIRSRWGMVLAVNEKSKESGLKVGQKVYLDELKWTRGFRYDKSNLKAWAIPIDDIVGIDEDGFDEDELRTLAVKYSGIDYTDVGT